MARDSPRPATRPALRPARDDVVFRSPAVHGDQQGKELATAYLSAAVVVLGPTLTYRRQWYAESNAVLEFEAELDGLKLHGIDCCSGTTPAS